VLPVTDNSILVTSRIFRGIIGVEPVLEASWGPYPPVRTTLLDGRDGKGPLLAMTQEMKGLTRVSPCRRRLPNGGMSDGVCVSCAQDTVHSIVAVEEGVGYM
jgi:hypothetical protein